MFKGVLSLTNNVLLSTLMLIDSICLTGLSQRVTVIERSLTCPLDPVTVKTNFSLFPVMELFKIFSPL